MELSWSTFLLEIINFLVLVWILKRFFYRPVQSVIARRQQGIEQRLAKAAEMESSAQELQQKYQGRLEQWRGEREQARESLDIELNAEREKRQAALQRELAQQREKAAAMERRQQQDQQRKLELQALEQGSEFAARLLEQAAGPELEQRLGDMLVDALEDLDDVRLQQLRAQLSERDMVAEVASAFPLAAELRQRIAELLRELLQREVQCHYVEDPELLAGLRIGIGGWELDANLRDELHGFAHLARELAGA
ncbi:F-type H+-transporting ATPase subunit b [Microbulbifer donghaiensis]|uniref:ATP synthase subunit b n=1 Tax=Microbulbifer donghaiensis TaxID=494016 RepID=A0A1M4UMQ3_9GAMM|nr:F0F1 ATP synthase subunit delta [Microbulbifer donghaiensis]SHE57850.1 F-type H+-transporting ATPase subunit b [Microbulbifer donghaiensis]